MISYYRTSKGVRSRTSKTVYGRARDQRPRRLTPRDARRLLLKWLKTLPPGERLVARVKPRLLPAAILDVAAPVHGRVGVIGLARFFPAHTVHAQRSTAVVTGNYCELRSVDHYHIHRVSVSLDPLLDHGHRAGRH